MNKYLAELIGTFLLLLAILKISATNKLMPLYIGLALTVSIIFGMNASGAHYNPVVSIIMMFDGKLTNNDTMLYIASQFLGGFTAYKVSKML